MTQADACIGIAGDEHAVTAATTTDINTASPQHHPKIAEAMLFLDKVRECYKNIEDIRGECETLAKRALLEKLRAADGGAGVGSDAAVEEAVGYISRYKSVLEGEGVLGETVG